ncbi:MAG: DNA repair protein RecO [Actinobacteria bacterium]|nr:DNA repair protein RecO [Actinomycetota bacterium]
MPSHRVRALSLKKTKLGETDLIVTFLAEDGCQIRAVAKGARKPGSRFGGRVEPFTVVDMLLHTGRTLETISDAEIVTSHAAIREDYDRAQAASVVADFLDKVSVECQTEDRLFALACATLDAMDGAEDDALLALVVAFLLKGMAMHGYRPQFDACAVCGSRAGAGEIRFALELGGPACEACSGAGDEAVWLSGDARAACKALMSAKMAEVAELGVPHGVLAEAFGVMRAFVVYHVPAKLKALGMYSAEVLRATRE